MPVNIYWLGHYGPTLVERARKTQLLNANAFAYDFVTASKKLGFSASNDSRSS